MWRGWEMERRGQTVSVISQGQSVITRTLTASDGIGSNPVAMVETSNGKKLYVVNQGDGTRLGD